MFVNICSFTVHVYYILYIHSYMYIHCIYICTYYNMQSNDMFFAGFGIFVICWIKFQYTISETKADVK